MKMKIPKYDTYKRRIIVWLNRHLLCIMLTIVTVAFIANFCLIFTNYSREIRGAFGDQFGAVNALFSGLAFAGLIYTIILQRKDLKLQRKEMKQQTQEFSKENETLKIQRFENTFFNMLSQFQEVVNNLKCSRPDKSGKIETVVGREFFEDAFLSIINEHRFDTEGTRAKYEGMKKVIELYGINGYTQSDIPPYFDHYFRLLYRILKYVYKNPQLSGFEEEYGYTSILRAMLSRYELVWLYYNGLSEYGRDKLKILIERYAMLKSLRDELLAETEKEVGEYANSAYKKTIPTEYNRLS